jgi:AcrR family transcriptional regulator
VGRRQSQGEQTRRRILDAAAAEFARRGYASVTVEEIAAAADVTKGAIYYWFADKDDLGRDLQHELQKRLTAVAQAALDPAADSLTNLRLGFDAYLAALSSVGEARFFLRDAWTIPALDEAGRGDQEAAVNPLTKLLADGIDRGEIAHCDPEALARVLLGVFAEATLHVLESGRRDETEQVVDLFLSGLAPGHSPRTRKRKAHTK